MEELLEIVVLGRACRNTANIKNRQPIGTMYVKAEKAMDKFYTDIIADDQEFADSKNTSAGGKTAPEMGKPIGDGFMSIPDGVEDESLPFN